jgi:hypothetical protein
LKLQAFEARLVALPKPVVRKDDLARLEAVEHQEAERRGLEEFKFATNEDMLAAMHLSEAVVPAR